MASANQSELIEFLEQVLEDAKTGAIQSVALAALGEDEVVMTSWCHHGSFAILLGAISCLQADFIHLPNHPPDEDAEEPVRNISKRGLN